MRHRKHNHLLGVKTAHRISLLANLSCSLIENGRITTTLAKARALRPTIEKVITLAKKAHIATDAAQKVHYRRLAIARIRNKKAVKKLFDELVEQFASRNGGYTRIYKLAMPRLGDAADMAIIEFVEEAPKKKAKKKKTSTKKPVKKASTAKEKTASTEDSVEDVDSSDDNAKDVEGETTETSDVSDMEQSKDNPSKDQSETESVVQDTATEAEPETPDLKTQDPKEANPASKEDSDSKEEEKSSKD
jgi:large subunit ribosomal protein L17